MEDSTKTADYPGDFKGGVMSPNSKRTFAEMHTSPLRLTPKQKLVLDEDSFEQSFLRCFVCKERFDMNEKAPRLLPCHHAFCMSCILKLFEKEVEYRRSLAPITYPSSSDMSLAFSILCPTCNSNFITTEEGLRQLTIDHRVVQLMDFIGQTDKQTIMFCPNHALQPLNFFCENCVQHICRDCTVLDHKACSKDKLVIDLANAIDKYSPVLEEGVKQMTEEIKSLEEKKTECEQSLEKCDKDDDQLKKAIKESFERLRQALNDREQEMLDMMPGNPVNSKEDIENKISKLSEKTKEVEDIVKAIDMAKRSKTVEELFKVYKRLGGYETEPGLEKEEANKSDQSEATFNSRDELTLISRIKNYGEIQTVKHSNGYGSSSRYSTSLGTGSSYLSTGSSSRYSSYTPSYSARYTPRTYKY